MIHTVCSLFFYQPDAISTFCPAKASIFYTFFQISSFRSGWLPIYFVNITHRFLLIFIDFPSNCHCIHTIFFLFTLHLFSKTAVDSHFFRAGISAFWNVCSMQVCLSLFILPKAKYLAGMSVHSGGVYLIYLQRKRYSVFSRYTAPARSTTLGNSGCSIAFGKCWVSRQKPSRL